MRAQMQVQPQRLARGSGDEERARIEPLLYVAEARRLQARAMAEALGVGWRAIGRGLSGLAAVVRWLFEPLARRLERNRAVYQLAGLDDRLLADIGLRRGDIALAVDGLLADPRVTRRVPAQSAAVTERLLEGERCPVPAASANSNRSASHAQSGRGPDLAA
jgi:uncharacterized protein YjiS (DUF1127 family)